MKAFVKNLIEKHCNLLTQVEELNTFLYGNGGLNPLTDIKNNKTQDALFRNITEFANKAICLRSLKTALLAVECELNNVGIRFEDGNYLECVATFNTIDNTKGISPCD